MKTIKLSILFTLIIFSLNSCGDSKTSVQDKVEKATEMKKDTSNNDLISRVKFDTMRVKWEQNFRAYMAADSLHYFDMAIEDLTEIISEDGLDSARFYMGMAPDTTGKLLPHLMLVGMTNGIPNFRKIADYSTACPPICNN